MKWVKHDPIEIWEISQIWKQPQTRVLLVWATQHFLYVHLSSHGRQGKPRRCIPEEPRKEGISQDGEILSRLEDNAYHGMAGRPAYSTNRPMLADPWACLPYTTFDCHRRPTKNPRMLLASPTKWQKHLSFIDFNICKRNLHKVGTGWPSKIVSGALLWLCRAPGKRLDSLDGQTSH